MWPDRWKSVAHAVPVDPILCTRHAARITCRMLQTYGSLEICASSRLHEIWRFFVFHLPRTWADVRELIPRIRPKVRETAHRKGYR